MTWIPCELHSHTVHSDGAMAPETLAQEAAAAGFGALALTDHNTASGRPEYGRQAEARGVVPLPGVELTTFFGHVLVWGAEPSVDWRVLGPSDLGPALAALGHRHQLAVGAAHPFRAGNPVCTGCYWEFDLPFDGLDCLEVWSGVDPDLLTDNHRALALWDDLLNQGVRITATAGRDWHRADPVPGLRSTTFVGVESREPGAFVEALRQGRAIPSLGPLPHLGWEGAGAVGGAVRFGAGDSGWGLPLAEVDQPMVVLKSGSGVLDARLLGGGSFAISSALVAGERWLRVEVRGRVDGRDRFLAFTNPLYLG